MGPNVMEFLWAKRREGMWMEFEATDSLPDITQVGIQNEHEPSKTLGDNRGKSYTNDSFLRQRIIHKSRYIPLPTHKHILFAFPRLASQMWFVAFLRGVVEGSYWRHFFCLSKLPDRHFGSGEGELYHKRKSTTWQIMTDFLVWWVLKGEQIERRGGVRMGTDCIDP